MTYGKFRNFLILLPQAKLREADPSIAWFEAATMVPMGRPHESASPGDLQPVLRLCPCTALPRLSFDGPSLCVAESAADVSLQSDIITRECPPVILSLMLAPQGHAGYCARHAQGLRDWEMHTACCDHRALRSAVCREMSTAMQGHPCRREGQKSF